VALSIPSAVKEFVVVSQEVEKAFELTDDRA
jgi:hypothetical protein